VWLFPACWAIAPEVLQPVLARGCVTAQHAWHRQKVSVSLKQGRVRGSAGVKSEVTLLPSPCGMSWCPLMAVAVWTGLPRCLGMFQLTGTSWLIYTLCSTVPQESPWEGTLHYLIDRSNLSYFCLSI